MTDGLATGTLESAATLYRVRAALYAWQVTVSPAIDLPPRLLVWEDQDGAVRLTFGNAAWIARPGAGDQTVAAMTGRLQSALREAGRAT
jgi:uncharacterized protein (DUF302 family)